MEHHELERFIREVADFPTKGIRFRDITPLLQSAEAWSEALDRMAEQIQPLNATKLVGIESRGFIFAAALSARLKTGLVLIRKRGKLPWKVERHRYDLEYGSDEIEIHQDAVDRTDRLVVVDDVLATGGTALAAVELCKKFNAQIVGVQVLIELVQLKGRDRFEKIPFFSLFKF